jgi:hypothetical protein
MGGQDAIRRVRSWSQIPQAHEIAIEQLLEELLDAARRHNSWREGFRAGLGQLIRFAVEHPRHAKRLLCEGRDAGGAARVKHLEVLERLSRAIDSARRETDSSRHSPPPMTGTLMVSAIEQAVCVRLSRREERTLWTLYPDLVHFVVLPYFGERAAWEDFDAAAADTSGGIRSLGNLE